jgi:uncharacterized protein YkwD
VLRCPPPRRARAAARLAAVAIPLLLFATGCDELERDLRTMVNAERSSRGISTLGNSDDLTNKAGNHAEAMAARRDLFHSNLWSGLSSRWSRVSENVGRARDVQAAHAAFMRSASHRANILDGRMRSLGVGVALGKDGYVYVVEVFAG